MNILIIGKDSYIGNHIDEWLTSYGHFVKQLDVLTDEWKTFDYSQFNAVVHVAGIVHRPDCNDWNLYKRVNTDMPIAIATMAKSQGVRTYVYFSTMGVYPLGKQLHKNVVTKDTPLHSDSFYGKSKLMAEEGLQKLQDASFNVVAVRPPSVYGKGCKGGYISGFAGIVNKLPIIPKCYGDCKQSFIYIDNLSEFVRLAIERNLSGAYCPQDDEAVSSNELIETIAEGMGKKVHQSVILGWFVRLFSFVPFVNKAYGGIEYDRQLSGIPGLNYVVVPFKEGMRRTVQ